MLMFDIDLWFVWAVMTHPELCTIYWFTDCNNSSTNSWNNFTETFNANTHDNTTVSQSTSLGHYIETSGQEGIRLSPVFLLDYCILILAMGYCWNDFGSPLFAIVKIVLENIEETRPIAILLSERAPTLEEAWQDALKDGNLSSGEFYNQQSYKSHLVFQMKRWLEFLTGLLLKRF